jgi:DNA-binding MurR/RpiR family transcriptional regulator
MFAAIELLLKDHLAQLTDNERRLVQVLVGDPGGATFLSGRELAQRAGVHESSAVRLAQKLGFDGYPAFRRALREQHSGAAAGPSLRVARTLAAAPGGELWHTLLGREVESLLACKAHVSQALLDQAAALLGSAPQIHIWAAGNAKVLADLLDRRLRSAGLPARNIAHEGRELAERLVTLGKGDVVVAFAFRREPRALAPIFAHARAVKAKTLLLADMVAHTLSQRPDQLLAAPRGDDEKFLTLSVPMLICNALVLTLAQRDHGRSINGLQTLETLRRELGADD